MPGPDGKGDYRGGGESIPKTGPGTIFDIDFGLNIMGRKRPPLRRQYKGSNNLKKNFIRDFMKAVRA